MIIHVVQPGESLYTIARKYGVPAAQIQQTNRLASPNRLVVGQSIVIPADVTDHTVRPGDSLYSIARQYGVAVGELQRLNPNVNPQRLQIGDVVRVPSEAQKLGAIEVNGYALPTINQDVLAQTLPNLTYLSPFSYQVKPDGSLIPIEDVPLITAARAQRVAPMMVITNIEEGGSFSSDIGRAILNSEQVQNTLLDNVERTIKEKNYFGLAIDFEYLYPEDREKYNAFIEKAVNRLRPQGYAIATALAPKTSGDQQGLLYEAHDYAAHGRLVDHVVLMTYEWGYTFSPPRAVAPIDEVRKVLDYAVTVIPSEKILLGMPNYGYDWTLPHVQGTAARTVSNTEAINLAAREGAQIQYDEQAQAPFFTYYDDNRKQHTVWFDDARSIEARLRLIDEYNLGGASYWTINRFNPQNWLILNSLYDVKEVL